MTEQDLARVEAELGVRLPADYRRVIATRGAELRGLTYRPDGVEPPHFEHGRLYLDPGELIGVNLGERGRGGTGYAFPRWHRTFVMVGTNGAGDYYCLRLSGPPACG